ncbi:L,D-transpeptidase family protein [Sphingomonas sp. RHCKR47]|uniref:L,D-transpeptidase family protein n=1 Tax=Sphingomonas citricola TaxID=2862498 RepID=UPI001CA5EBB5|nr:L,D-transpeptidase family protein [Sphingomonas citricola]MBW6524929.1 L,D-transpeptidase family protein [Sphingomonas citricola]
MLRRALLLAAPVLAGACFSYPVQARVMDGLALTEAAASLAPNRYLWSDDQATGPVSILISIPDQRAYVFRGETLVAASTVSTGKAGNDTPTGSFTILQKNARHFSNRYDNAPMPYMQRLTWDGVALHAGANPGFPASHGCIRLPTAFAKKLFEITQLGATVEVTDEAYVSGMDAPVYTPAAVSRDHEVGETARANEREGIAQAMRAD